MKYSESSDYMVYAQCKAAGDIAGARVALMACLNHPEFKSQAAQYADLLQRMGELYFLEGQHQAALQYYRQSEIADRDSLLVKYYFAEFLGMVFGDKKSASDICDRIVSIARNNPFSESDDDFSSDAYIEKAEQLRAALLS